MYHFRPQALILLAHRCSLGGLGSLTGLDNFLGSFICVLLEILDEQPTELRDFLFEVCLSAP